MSGVPLGRLRAEVSSLSLLASPALPADDLPVSGVAYDSRRVRGGEVFVCLRGQLQDGHRYAAAAARAGAALIVGEEAPPAEIAPVPYLRVIDARRALALLSCAFHDHPSRALTLTAFTGTNGKSSSAWMLHQVHLEAGWPSAVLGTLGAGTPGGAAATALPAVPLEPGAHTTPEAPELQGALARWREAGVRAGALEASSHGLELRRSYGTRFACVVFTNLTIDHLDFHGTLADYRAAKARLFRAEERGPEEPPAAAVMNADDPASVELLRGSSDRVTWYGRGERADVRLLSSTQTALGTVLSIGQEGKVTEVRSPLLGDFQIDNLLAAFAAGCALGIDAAVAARGLGRLRGVPGRMERVERGQPFPVLIDYAHTPDALARACASLRACTAGRLLLVFGCGGDRDRGKRPLMGAAAARGAERIFLTDDNPRHETPEEIRAAVRRGIEEAGGSCLEIGDREEAIRAALREAHPGDTVLIAGKGHETGQIRGDVVHPFDDREVAARLLSEVGS